MGLLITRSPAPARALGREIDHLAVDAHAELGTYTGHIEIDGAIVDPRFELAVGELGEIDDDGLGLGILIEADVVAHAGKLLQILPSPSERASERIEGSGPRQPACEIRHSRPSKARHLARNGE
jgi:hypothetical protein